MVKKATEATPNHLLRAARKEHNWTQKEVADRIGSPQSFNVSRWEQGTAFPSAHYIQQLCLLFGKSARELGLLLEEHDESSRPPTGADSLLLWNVPYRRNPFFTGRQEVLAQIRDRLKTTQSAALTQTQAISGLGGIGKTQIAVEYAYRHREEYQTVFWVRAASQGALISDFVTLATLLGLPEQNEQDQNIVVAAVKRWLVHHTGWLLILDNADDLELVAEFLPTGDNGHILLTTRAQATGSIAPSITVEKMEYDEGILLLLRRAKLLAPDALLEQVSDEEYSQARVLVEIIDALPLALDQAGAYIEETGCGLPGYLELYRTHRKELLRRRSALRSDHPESVASTLALSFLKVEQISPAAADLLRLCAFLDPDAIPEEIITRGVTKLGPVLELIATHPLALNEAIQALRAYSLVKRHAEAGLLNIHRLVQVVLKDDMDEQGQQLWTERAVRAVDASFPEAIFSNWKQCERLLSQASACASLIEYQGICSPEAARLLTRAGWYLRERGQYTQAEQLFHQVLVLREQVLGSNHPDTASILEYLGIVYRDQGRYEQAELFLKRALSIREEAIGPEHPDTAEALNELGILYHFQGKYTQAEPLLKRNLAINERVRGPEHPETIASLNNLAHLYESQGLYVQAEVLHEQVLAIREKAPGSENPEIALTLNNLASVYRKRGKYAQAESLYQRSLVIKEKVLGPEHSDTVASLDNLGQLYTYMGRYEQAESLHLRALTIYEEGLGPEHPDTAVCLWNLGLLYDEQGRYGEAESLYKRALAIQERVLGQEHPATASTLNNLGILYAHQERYDEAEPLLLRALAIREHALVPEHPSTALTFDGLGFLYAHWGRYDEAEPFLLRALAIQERMLGPEHPATAGTLNDLGILYAHQERYDEAELLYERALRIREKVLGIEHPATAMSLHILSELYLLKGAHGEAELLEQRALSIRERILGPEHLDTASSLYNMARIYQAQARYEEAKPFYQRALAIREKVLGPELTDTVKVRVSYANLLEIMESSAEVAKMDRPQ